MPRRLLVPSLFLLFTTGACATRMPSGSQPPRPDASPPPVEPAAFGPSIALDTMGVEFGPWVRLFIAAIKRHWFIPYEATQYKGHVVVTFRVRKDGTIDGLSLKEPSTVAAFNDSALAAISAVKRTDPLPAAYPAEYALFTVTFYYNEEPPQAQPGGQRTAT